MRNSQDLVMGGLAHSHISPAHHCSQSQKCAHVPCSTQHGYSMEINSRVPQRPTNPQNITHWIHVWYIYLHLVIFMVNVGKYPVGNYPIYTFFLICSLALSSSI